MFFRKKKLPEILRCSLTTLERKILDTVAGNLQANYKEKFISQINYIKMIRRIKYKTETVIELYPESLDSIPEDTLFGRSQEFVLAILKYNINDKTFRCSLRAVLGAIFELTITPSPNTKMTDNINLVFFLKDIQVEQNLESNIN